MIVSPNLKQNYLIPYHNRIGVGTSCIIGVALIIICSLALAGKLSYGSINVPHLSVGLFVAAVLSVGAIFVIQRARQGFAKGKLLGTEHWKRGQFLFSYKNGIEYFYEFRAYHLDLSTVDENGNGIVKAYPKGLNAASLSAAGSVLAMPLYITTVIVYNCLRFVVIPFYVALQLVRESFRETPLYPEEGFFTTHDITKQMGVSLRRVVKASFYGTGLFYTSLYTILDPLNGIKIGSAIESDWNEGVLMRNQGIWMMGTRIFPNWQWEGGGGPKTLGNNGFYYAGSWQPSIELTLHQWSVLEYYGLGGLTVEETHDGLSCMIVPIQ